ncbi:MAG: glycosyltransferase [Prevotellaceae bacterium]|jgi:glycosyltransferase involved in cell wall biosynthesis|nr:glycosyltransferase [Prevotellaceae bacterium]
MREKFYIIMPCYNDWESLSVLLANIDKENERHRYDFHIVVINDGSSQDIPCNNFSFPFIKEFVCIDLIRNMGHQRAISIALSYISDTFTDYKGVIVMDCDGEDDYKDLFRFIDEFSEDEIIFARRRKRKEPLSFRIFYRLYKFVFRCLTGNILQGGNYSLIPHAMMNKVVHLSEIWNHYHAGILKSRLKIKYVDCNRAQRYKGISKMNFASLVTHGLSAVSVFNDTVFVRLTLFAIVFFVVSILAIALILFMKFVLHIASPGWATNVIGIFLILCVQVFSVIIGNTFITLGRRDMNAFLPIREYKNYIMRVRPISFE